MSDEFYASHNDPVNISSDSNCRQAAERYLHTSRGDMAALVEELRD